MGVIKDLWDSCELARMQNKGPVRFDLWKDEHPEYVKTTKSMSMENYNHRCKSRSFEQPKMGQ